MITEPWVHICLDRHDVEFEIAQLLRPNGLICILDGSVIRGLGDFYIAIERAVPLISGFGRNLDALVDLIRTFGVGAYAGKSHCLIWRKPDRMMAASCGDFDVVSNLLVGVAKELLVSEEVDPTFDASDEEDWIATRLDLVFMVESADRIDELAMQLSRLSPDWAGSFHTLDVPVDVLR